MTDADEKVSGLVERLRRRINLFRSSGMITDAAVEEEAANRIEALERENGRLRAIVRVNLLRHVPGATHASIDELLSDGTTPLTEQQVPSDSPSILWVNPGPFGNTLGPDSLVRQIMLAKQEAATWSQWKRDAYRAALQEEK